jgi:Concanavalin A-like lectin/glucanases superfamily
MTNKVNFSKTILALALCIVALGARAAAFFDDFESYAVGSNLHGQGGWAGWAGNASAGALVSPNFAFSPTRSVNITGASDLVHNFSGATNGQWVFSVMQYIPSTSTGTNYVILLNTYRSPYGAADLNWSVQIQCNMATGQISDLGGSATLPMVKDQWVEVRCEINLDANSVSEFYNGQLLSTHAWQNGTGVNEIQALDLFANNAAPVYYDNVSLAPTGCIPPPANLALWLPFDEASGPISANLAAGGNNGTQVNGPAVVTGYVLRSLCFDGASQYVSVLDYPAINPGTGDLTIDAWVRRATNSGTTVRVIVDKRDPSTGVGYSLAVSFGNLVFQLADTSGFTNYRDTGTVPADDQWHFVAVSVSRSLTNGGRFYIDGSATGTFDPTAHPGSLNNTAPFLVASSPLSFNSPWLGCIDEVEFFSRALMPLEFLGIFNAGSAGKCKCVPPPANMGLWLPFDEASGPSQPILPRVERTAYR